MGDTGRQCELDARRHEYVCDSRATRLKASETPRIDHIAYTIENWDKNAVKAELERRGLNPRPDTENSFHMKDVNGFDLQISGKEMKPA